MTRSRSPARSTRPAPTAPRRDGRSPTTRSTSTTGCDGYGVVRIAKTMNTEGASSPRSQQGRPRAWAASSVRALLFRELYRGVVVWNKTRKRDSWGKVKFQSRPATAWMRIAAPAARIVSDAAWERAHERMAATRATYVRTQAGRLWGRPASGLAGKYLLTAIAQCGHCGGGLEGRSRKHGRARRFYYSCSSTTGAAAGCARTGARSR